jgi:hypothetical protein
MSNQKHSSAEPIIQTTDETGKVHTFKLIEIFEVDKEEYGLFNYMNPEPSIFTSVKAGEDAEIIVMKIVKKDGHSYFEIIEDEEEFNYVLDYIEKHEEELEFE